MKSLTEYINESSTNESRLPEVSAAELFDMINSSDIKKYLNKVREYNCISSDELWDLMDRYINDGDGSEPDMIRNEMGVKPSENIVCYNNGDGDILYFICKDRRTADKIYDMLPNTDMVCVL